jgi:hypothetical protein
MSPLGTSLASNVSVVDVILRERKGQNMKTVKITANMGNGKFEAYNVPFECRYFAANELVNMGAVGVSIGNVTIDADELTEVA